MSAYRFALESDISGPVNLVAPNPVTSRQFARLSDARSDAPPCSLRPLRGEASLRREGRRGAPVRPARASCPTPRCRLRVLRADDRRRNGSRARRTDARRCRASQDNGGVPELQTLGWDDGWNAAFEPYAREGQRPGRVAVQHRGEYDVLTADGEQRSRITSRLRRSADRAELPVVGDWIALDGSGSIAAVLPRRTTISRRAAHEPASGVSREQVIAANVDVVLRRPGARDRSSTLDCWSGTSRSRSRAARGRSSCSRRPTSSPSRPPWRRSRGHRRRRPGAPACPRAPGVGLEAVRAALPPGRPAPSSGRRESGRSTLVNALVGDDARLATGERGSRRCGATHDHAARARPDSRAAA